MGKDRRQVTNACTSKRKVDLCMVHTTDACAVAKEADVGGTIAFGQHLAHNAVA